MFFKVLRKISRPHWYQILTTLRASGGLPALEIGKRTHLSYMGAKQHCDNMKKVGLLETRRLPSRPGKKGRPQKLYIASEDALSLYRGQASEFSLEVLSIIAKLDGEIMLEKVVKIYFDQKTKTLAKQIYGGTARQRLMSLAKILLTEGYSLERKLHEDGAALRVYFSPYAKLTETYKIAGELESHMFSRLVGEELQRREAEAEELFLYEFLLHGRGKRIAKIDEQEGAFKFSEGMSSI